jgi:ADP-heptose:LPS heptosyltransferase
MRKQLLKSFLLKLITKKKKNDFNVKLSKKVLMLRYDRIGDMIITTPIFREFKSKYPDVEINVLASKVNSTIIKNNEHVDNIYINHKNNFFLDLPVLLKLRAQKIDVCFEFDHSVIRHAILRLKIINPKKIISVKKEGRYGVSGEDLNIYDFYTEKKKNEHFRNIWLETLSPFGIKPKSNKYDIYLDKENENKADEYLKKFKDKFLIGINLEGVIKGKKITSGELIHICNGLIKLNKNIQIIIISEPIKEKSLNKEINKMNLNFVSKSYTTTTILDASALIKRLNLIITPDTSIVHVASTFNIPVISIHEKNYESYKLFSPTSELNRTIFSDSKNSLSGFSVDDLLRASKEIMELVKIYK